MHIVLNSFGASIRKSNSLFEVSTTAGKQDIHPRDIESITVSKGARISSDAVLLAIENEIDVLFVDGIGRPQGRVWSIKYGSISDIRKQQIEFLYTSDVVDWVKELIVEKINNQIAMLLAMKKSRDLVIQRKLDAVINSLEDYKSKIRKIEGEVISDIAPSMRGWEGAASKRYFRMLSECLPVDYQFEKRSQNPAQDWFNAMLNYGYGILYGKIEGALIKAGIDPYVGVFHRDDYNRPALVFDVIEKYRVWVDFVIIHLCIQQAMSEDCFRPESNGMWLEGLGKRIVIQSINDYLAEVISIKGLERSRSEHINRYAHQLAALFLKGKSKLKS
jgi:CRISPR-associated protein Cas1